MKKAKKIFKVIVITNAIFFAVIFASLAIFYNIVTSGVTLNKDKFTNIKSVNALKIYDSEGNLLDNSNSLYIPLSKLSSDTKNAFISAEDKRFYSHNGLDYIRIGGAIISNVKSKSFSQGGSTISQQLIKNTQLSSEKTIRRKLKEFKLTKQLEKDYSKDEILESYLNSIYFGGGAYGIENASMHYFGKSASKLTLAESALLAGTINAPSVYDIQNNPEKAISRRNLILELMKNYKKIDEDACNQAKDEPLNLNILNTKTNTYSYSAIIDEACEVLGISQNYLKNNDYKIFTYLDKNLESITQSKIKKYNIETNPEIATFVIDNKTKGIVSVTGKKSIISKRWQPGSTIKPILVYAPAIENNIISPATKILDNKINYSGYSPENADKKYHGYVSARVALKNSYNIPAVKLLNEIGISNAQNFAKKLNIDFDEKDNNLAIALGGFTNGLNIKTLCDAYSAFSTDGKFEESKFISKITKDGKIVYERNLNLKQVMSNSTAYLVTDMLKDCSKSGTAKRLKNFNYEIASKTGTVGENNSNKNCCAYCISYTTDHTILSFIGGNNMPESINGATYPTMINKDILEILYPTKKPNDFIIPKTIKKIAIDKFEYEQNNKIIETEKSENISEYFSNSFLPKKGIENNKLTIINIQSHKPILCFTSNKNTEFFIIREHKNKQEIINSCLNLDNKKHIKFEDLTAKSGEIYSYKIKFCEKSTNEEYFSNSIKLKCY